MHAKKTHINTYISRFRSAGWTPLFPHISGHPPGSEWEHHRYSQVGLYLLKPPKLCFLLKVKTQFRLFLCVWVSMLAWRLFVANFFVRYFCVPLRTPLSTFTSVFSQDSVTLSSLECTVTPHWRSCRREPQSPSSTACPTSTTPSRSWLTSSLCRCRISHILLHFSRNRKWRTYVLPPRLSF